MSNTKNVHWGYLLLFIQPIFMASNLIVARGGVEFVPPNYGYLYFYSFTIHIFIIKKKF